MKFSFVLVLSLLLYSCESSTDADIDKKLAGKLSAELVTNPASLEKQNSKSSNEIGHLSFKDTVHEFGRIHEGEVIEYEFSFTNSGKKNVLITKAEASCGCTIPTYPKEPIAPNESGMIKVEFNSSGKFGHNEKTIDITTNASPSVYVLKIIADIEKNN